MMTRLTAGLAAVVLGMVGALTSVSPVHAAAPEFQYQVQSQASPLLEIPGTSITFSATAGATSYLYVANMRTENVTALQSGDNIGNTFVISCRYANGTALSGNENGAYWATNLVPPGETSVTPTLRWLFVAPTSAEYRCVASIVSYSTIVPGKQVTMRIPAGSELRRSTYPAATRWTLPVESERVIAEFQTITSLGYTYAISSTAPKMAITQDVALTTCKANSSVCEGGVSTNPGTTVRTWVEAEPRNADGTTVCGPKLTSPQVTRFISTAKHHLTATNTLYLTKDQLGGCPKVRVSIRIENVDGNPVLLHAGWAFGTPGLARSHGVGFEYN